MSRGYPTFARQNKPSERPDLEVSTGSPSDTPDMSFPRQFHPSGVSTDPFLTKILFRHSKVYLLGGLLWSCGTEVLRKIHEGEILVSACYCGLDLLVICLNLLSQASEVRYTRYEQFISLIS